MKKQLHNRSNAVLCACLTVVMLLTALLGAARVFAFSGDIRGHTIDFRANSTYPYDNTAVLDDLQSAVIDGNLFNIENYPQNINGTVQMFPLVEFAYSKREQYKKDFALYVYIYNPALLNIQESGNKIQFATDYGATAPIDYAKYGLVFCNKSTDNLFVKFRVEDENGDIYKRVSANDSNRRYDVSSVELQVGGSNAVDCGVGGTWVYSGFAKGLGADETEESTLKCVESKGVETISLNVEQSSYTSGSSSAGSYKYNQLHSVYFSVPQKIIDRYGTLQKIHAEWFEAYTRTIVALTNNKTLEAWKSNHLNATTTTDFGWFFNISNKNDTISREKMLEYYEEHLELDCKKYAGNSNLENLNPNGVPKAPGCLFSNYSYTQNYGGFNVNRKFGYNNVIIDAGESYDLLSYSDTHGFWNKVDDFGFWDTMLGNVPTDNSLKDIKPIVSIDKSMYRGISDDKISTSLYIDKSDVANFKAYATAAEKKQETMFLFRFANSVCNKSPITDDGLEGYLAGQVVFLDFDIIDLTFQKDGNFMTIAAVSSPIDVIANVSPPTSYERAWYEILWDAIVNAFTNHSTPIDWVIIVVTVIVCVFVLILVLKLLGAFLGLFRR